MTTLSDRIILASASAIRSKLLSDAGVAFEAQSARIDEAAIRGALLAEGHKARDVADALAQGKAEKIAGKAPDAWVIGSDQVLEFDGDLLSKPESAEAAANQLRRLRGNTHSLYTAAVISEAGRPVWRHVSRVRLTMQDFSDDYLEAYLARNWPGIQSSVGGYKLEEEGIRLFNRIDGDYFAILGLPLIEILTYLSQRGVLET